MRDYAKISPHFWIGNTGRKLREAGGDTMLVAFYLLTSPHANMIGLYYLPCDHAVSCRQASSSSASRFGNGT